MAIKLNNDSTNVFKDNDIENQTIEEVQPKQEEDSNKKVLVSVYLAKKERERLKSHSKNIGIPVSSYIRSLILDALKTGRKL